MSNTIEETFGNFGMMIPNEAYTNADGSKPLLKPEFMEQESELAKAIKVLTEELSKDKSEGSYYYSWQANIAMAFKDEWYRLNEATGGMSISSDEVHSIANQAAKRFLDMLCHKNNDMNDVIKVADRLYREANPETNMDTPSYAYEQVNKANRKRLEDKSKLSLYDWCKLEFKKSDK